MDSSGTKSGLDGLRPGLNPEPLFPPVIDSSGTKSGIDGFFPGLNPDPPALSKLNPELSELKPELLDFACLGCRSASS